MECLEEADGNLGRLHTVFPERELIKLPHAVPVVLAERVEELEGLHKMHRADHHVVIPAAEVVVDINREQPACVDTQLRGIGRCFLPVPRMTEVQTDAPTRT